MADATVSPATGETVREIVERSHRAFGAWRGTPVAERAARMRELAEPCRERKHELAALITEEMGEPVRQSVGEVLLVASVCDFCADRAERFLAAPHLMLGNTVVLEHATGVPQAALVQEQLLRGTGFPDDAYRNVLATNERISELVISARTVQGVSLSGSERAGSAVAEVAGRHLEEVVLEPGGSDPFVDAFARAVDAAQEAASRVEPGTVFVDEVTGTAPDLPVGGVKRSGVGRVLGRFGIEEFANKKLIHAPQQEEELPLQDEEVVSPCSGLRRRRPGAGRTPLAARPIRDLLVPGNHRSATEGPPCAS